MSDTTPEQLRARMAQWQAAGKREAEELRAMTTEQKVAAIDRLHESIDSLGIREALHAEQGRGREVRLELLIAMEARQRERSD